MESSDDNWVIALSGTGLIRTIRRLENEGVPYKIQHVGDKTIHVLVPKQYLPKVVEITQRWEDHGYDDE